MGECDADDADDDIVDCDDDNDVVGGDIVVVLKGKPHPPLLAATSPALPIAVPTRVSAIPSLLYSGSTASAMKCRMARGFPLPTSRVESKSHSGFRTGMILTIRQPRMGNR